MNGDLRNNNVYMNGDLRKIAVCTNGDLRYTIFGRVETFHLLQMKKYIHLFARLQETIDFWKLHKSF